MTRPLPDHPIRTVGLTGSIATGKSEACATLRRLGVTVIDADELARIVVEPGQPALAEVREVFGDQVILPDNTLDRPALAKIIFADATARARLEAIIHPRVAEQDSVRVGKPPSELRFVVQRGDVRQLVDLRRHPPGGVRHESRRRLGRFQRQ